MIAALIASAVGAIAFAFLIRAPAREAPFGGIAAAFAGGSYWLAGHLGAGTTASVFVAALAVSAASEILARIRRVPASVFLTPGLIPLVPGLLAYGTMYDFVRGRTLAGIEMAVKTLLWAGALGLGIVLVVTVARMTARAPGKEFPVPAANSARPEEEGGRPPRGRHR